MMPGIVLGVMGTVILLAMVLVRRKMDGKPTFVFNGKAIGATPGIWCPAKWRRLPS